MFKNTLDFDITDSPYVYDYLNWNEIYFSLPISSKCQKNR